MFFTQVFMFGTTLSHGKCGRCHGPRPCNCKPHPKPDQAKVNGPDQRAYTPSMHLFVHLLLRDLLCAHILAKGRYRCSRKTPEALKSMQPEIPWGAVCSQTLVHSYTSALRATGLSNLLCQGFFSVLGAHCCSSAAKSCLERQRETIYIV